MHTWTRCRLQGMQVPNVHVPWLAMSFFCHGSVEMCWIPGMNRSRSFKSLSKLVWSPNQNVYATFMFQTVHDIFQDWLQSMCGLQRWIHLDLGVRLSVGFRELGFQHQGGSPLVPVGNSMLLATRWPDVRLHARSNRNRLIIQNHPRHAN